MRTAFPLLRKDYITERNQVRTSGALIKGILQRYDETRTYAAEGGRTTRGTVPAAEKLVAKLNTLEVISRLPASKREELIDELQKWLVERVREFFDRKKLQVEVDLNKPGPRIIADILASASNKVGPVAQHLVGAKLALRYPAVKVENYSYTTADKQLKRPGDFVIGDTVFHVTISPMPRQPTQWI